VQPVFRASNPLIYRSTGLGMSALPTEFAPFPRLGADGWSAASDAVGKSVTFRHKIGTGFQCANRKALIYGKRRGSPVGALGGLHPGQTAAILRVGAHLASILPPRSVRAGKCTLMSGKIIR